MKYYKYDDEYSLIDGGVTYVEVDNGQAWRQLTVKGERYLASSLIYPYWGMMLADGQIDYDSIDEVTEISQVEFEAVWNACLANHRRQWDVSKQTHPVGITVEGFIQIFYPQGVIVNLGNDTLGVADYALCKASAQPEWMYPGYRVTAVVEGYDKVNHWLILGKPRVHGDRVHDYRVGKP